LTVGVTETAGGVGIASTTYLRGVVMHNTGLATATSSLYIYPDGVAVSGAAQTSYRFGRVDLAKNDTYFFELNYPLVMVDGDKLVVEVSAPSIPSGGSGIGSVVNVQVLGDTDIV
jgi:hypothetical protein